MILEFEVCGRCRGPALSLVQSAAHPSPLHLLPDADRLHCSLSYTLQDPMGKLVHMGFEQLHSFTDWCFGPMACWSIKLNIVTL